MQQQLELVDVNWFEQEYEPLDEPDVDFSVFDIEGLELSPPLEQQRARRILSSR